MMNSIFVRTMVMFACLVVLGLVASSQAQTNHPAIVSIHFDNQLKTGQTGRGQIVYEKAADGLEAAFFSVVDGRFHPKTVGLDTTTDEGQVFFELTCTEYSQQVALSVTLQDQAGRLSPPKLLRFQCGNPQHFNFTAEQARVRPISDSLKLNFFILDDGVTELSDAAKPTNSPLFSVPSALVQNSIRSVVVPSISNIWDQCGLSFETNLIKVVHHRHIELGNRNFFDSLYLSNAFHPTIEHSQRSSQLFEQANYQLIDTLRDLGEPVTLDHVNVFVVGSPIRSMSTGDPTYIEGFGQMSSLKLGSRLVQPRYTVVRWGSIFGQDGDITLPRQMISTLAHELGHNLGLDHPSEHSSTSVSQDENNLMKGSGVTPEPRSNLQPAQCNEFRTTLLKIRQQFQAWSLNTKLRSDSAYLHLPTPQANDLTRGFVEMRNAVRMSLHNNSLLSWVVKIQAEEINLNDSSKAGGPADVLIRPEGWQYVSLIGESLTLLTGKNGEYELNMDLKLIVNSDYQPNDYSMTLGYTVHSL